MRQSGQADVLVAELVEELEVLVEQPLVALEDDGDLLVVLPFQR